MTAENKYPKASHMYVMKIGMKPVFYKVKGSCFVELNEKSGVQSAFVLQPLEDKDADSIYLTFEELFEGDAFRIVNKAEMLKAINFK